MEKLYLKYRTQMLKHSPQSPQWVVFEVYMEINSLVFLFFSCFMYYKKDTIRQCLTSNKRFFVKSFYSLLNDRSLHCQVTQSFWKNICSRKINLFNWLVQKNKILILENLMKKRCNKLPIMTCVIYLTTIENMNHLFLQCTFAEWIWSHVG